MKSDGVPRRKYRRDLSHMRIIALEVLATIAALTFLGALVAIAVHRSAHGPQDPDPWRSSALAEYLWAMVPWLIVAACVLPSVRRIVASD